MPLESVYNGTGNRCQVAQWEVVRGRAYGTTREDGKLVALTSTDNGLIGRVVDSLSCCDVRRMETARPS